MSWFYRLTGIDEINGDYVREQMILDGEFLVSKQNNRRMRCGRLQIANFAELSSGLPDARGGADRLRLSERVGDVGKLHKDSGNAGAVFQAASQFNLLEMISPSVTPDAGIGDYEHDFTQGPTCAIACGAGTIFRNYFIELDGKRGQSADRQVDCLADLGRELGNVDSSLWEMQNGYAFASLDGLQRTSDRLNNASEADLRTLEDLIRVGVQWDAEVTTSQNGHCVTQVYCSALPLGYSAHHNHLWSPFAQLVLRATYRATFAAAAINWARTGNQNVYLTLVGGGVFRNDTAWITDAILNAAREFEQYPLDCKIVSYGQSQPAVQALVAQWGS